MNSVLNFDADDFKPHEECGVFGVYSFDGALSPAYACYNGLLALQHRGQESCGIAVSDRGVISYSKDLGLVNEVFNDKIITDLVGEIAISHVRYSTAKQKSRENAQPIVMRYAKGNFAIAFNGSLTNSFELREELSHRGAIFQTSNDAEVIAYLIAQERVKAPSIEEAVIRAMPQLRGCYSLLVMSAQKLIALRDPHGFRPLALGRVDDTYVFASETCALDSCNAEFVKDINPGEMVVVDPQGIRYIDAKTDLNKSLCIFEYIYFARPDSVIEGASVHEARLRAGAFLALEHPVQADIVIGVPDSGIDAAIGYSHQSGIPYGIGFIKNKYIGRTFISPGQSSREDKVRIKLNAVASVVKGKRVVLIDDSIVRGTTSGRIVKLLRDAGATEVHMRVSAPPFLNPCYYGTDIDSREHLIACHHSIKEISDIIGTDSLGYLSVENAKKLAVHANGCECGYCTACFSGEYPTNIPTEMHKDKFDRKISESKEKTTT